MANHHQKNERDPNDCASLTGMHAVFTADASCEALKIAGYGHTPKFLVLPHWSSVGSAFERPTQFHTFKSQFEGSIVWIGCWTRLESLSERRKEVFEGRW